MAGANVLQFLRYGAGNTMDPVLLLLYFVVLCCTLLYLELLMVKRWKVFYDDYSTRSKEIYTEKMRDV
jgi:hypothetical protein